MKFTLLVLLVSVCYVSAHPNLENLLSNLQDQLDRAVESGNEAQASALQALIEKLQNRFPSEAAAQPRIVANIFSLLAGALNAGQVADQLKELQGNLLNQLRQFIQEVSVASVNVKAQGLEILSKMVSQLLAHTGSAQSIVQAAIEELKNVVGLHVNNAIDNISGNGNGNGNGNDNDNGNGKPRFVRPLLAWLLEALNIEQIKDQLAKLQQDVSDQLTSYLEAILKASANVKVQGLAIISKMVSQLLAHTGSAQSIVQAAIEELKNVVGLHVNNAIDNISGNGKRNVNPRLFLNFLQYLHNQLGLEEVLNNIKGSAQNAKDNFLDQLQNVFLAANVVGGKIRVDLDKIVANTFDKLKDHADRATDILNAAIVDLQGVASNIKLLQ